MDRRLLGAITLMVVLAVVVGVSAAGGRRVAGSARPSDPVPPPTVGLCLLQSLPTEFTAGGGSPAIPLDGLTLGPCTGTVFGQVVGLLPTAATVAPGRVSPTADCAAAAAAFAGLVVDGVSATAPGDPVDDPVEWRPTIGARFHTAVPNRWAAPTGQQWTACVATPTRAESFPGTLSGAFATGSLPDQFGLCWAGTDLDSVPALLPCDEPHPAELLATGWIQDRSVLPATEMEASCRSIAALLMRTTDPARGGVVDVVMDPVRRDGSVNPNDPLVIGCFVQAVGNSQLTGTVIGLGDAPVPLTG